MLQEAKAKEAITQLKAEIANLTRLAEAGSALSMGEEATLNELMKQKEELTKERDAQVKCPHLLLQSSALAAAPDCPITTISYRVLFRSIFCSIWLVAAAVGSAASSGVRCYLQLHMHKGGNHSFSSWKLRSSSELSACMLPAVLIRWSKS